MKAFGLQAGVQSLALQGPECSWAKPATPLFDTPIKDPDRHPSRIRVLEGSRPGSSIGVSIFEVPPASDHANDGANDRASDGNPPGTRAVSE